MSQYNLGQAAIVSKGAYSGSTAYLPLNTVSNLGGSFMCTAPCTGIEPGVTSGWASYWVPMARGIKTYTLSVSGSTATVNIVFTDGGTYSTSYSTAAVGDNSVGAQQLIDRSVTGGKIALATVKEENLDTSTLDHETVNLNTNQVRPIFVTSTVPTTSSADGIYLVY